MSWDLRVLVIGGGVGGLTLAIAQRRAGYDAHVFERAVEFDLVGAGLHLWSSAMAVFAQIGLREPMLDIGHPVERFEFRTAGDRMLASWPVGAWGRETGVPASIGVRRADLHDVLVRHLDRSALHLGATCIGFQQDGPRVTARFADGREETGGVLVGADGLHSVVRAGLHGYGAPNFTGAGAWRALVDASGIEPLLDGGVHCIWYGAGRRFVIYPGGGNHAYWELIANATLDRAQALMTPGQLLDATEGYPPVIREIGQATLDPSSILMLARYAGNHDGAAYGWENSPQHAGSWRLHHRTPVRGLFLTGHWTQPGSGAFRVIFSGVETTLNVLGAGYADESVRNLDLGP